MAAHEERGDTDPASRPTGMVSDSPPLLTDDVRYWVRIAEGRALSETHGSDSEPLAAAGPGEPSTAASGGSVGQNSPSVSRVTDGLVATSPVTSSRFLGVDPDMPQASDFGASIAGEPLPSSGFYAHPSSGSKDGPLRLASRGGRLLLADDGQSRYYSAANCFSLGRSDTFSLLAPNVRTVRTYGDTALRQCNLTWEGDEDLEADLVEQFLKWHNPYFQEIEKDLFFREKTKYEQGQESASYSPTLYNAILSIGARYSDRYHPSIGDKAADFFARRAEVLLYIELDCPKLSTLQAVLLLGGIEAACARDARGWLYMGMAVQLITDLGLHMDARIREDEPPQSSTELATFRRKLFWTCYKLDILWCLDKGRRSIMEQLRRDIFDEDHGMMSPTNDRFSHNGGLLPPYMDTQSVGGSVEILLRQLIQKSGAVSDRLYTASPRPIESEIPFLQKMTADLVQWRQALPAAVKLEPCKVDARCSTENWSQEAIFLNMLFNETLVLLNRPFLPFDITSSFSIELASPVPMRSSWSIDCSTSATPRDHCFDGARAIVSLIASFKRQYGLQHAHPRMVHSLVTAGTMLACFTTFTTFSSIDFSPPQIASFSPERTELAQKALRLCIQALAEMGRAFDSAIKGMELVMGVRRAWQA